MNDKKPLAFTTTYHDKSFRKKHQDKPCQRNLDAARNSKCRAAASHGASGQVVSKRKWEIIRRALTRFLTLSTYLGQAKAETGLFRMAMGDFPLF